jgi:hypothetical protein
MSKLKLRSNWKLKLTLAQLMRQSKATAKIKLNYPRLVPDLNPADQSKTKLLQVRKGLQFIFTVSMGLQFSFTTRHLRVCLQKNLLSSELVTLLIKFSLLI